MVLIGVVLVAAGIGATGWGEESWVVGRGAVTGHDPLMPSRVGVHVRIPVNKGSVRSGPRSVHGGGLSNGIPR
jgi:hypothetical protein